jgi:Holliday junction DNA helicase RuvA
MRPTRQNFYKSAIFQLCFRWTTTMIGRLTGLLLEKNAPWVVLDVHGVGYEIQVPMSSFFSLPSLGEKTQLLTQLIVREDAHQLFGFLTAAERETFRELIKISGVGARTALAVLSGLSVDELRQAITLQEPALLTKIPGIGKKTAERMLLELKGKLSNELPTLVGHSKVADSSMEIIQALIALGYSEKEAQLVSKQIPAGSSVNDGLRLALKALMKP